MANSNDPRRNRWNRKRRRLRQERRERRRDAETHNFLFMNAAEVFVDGQFLGTATSVTITPSP
jgi:hypothetical protein